MIVQNETPEQELIKASKMPGLVTPRYDGFCISNIPDTISRILQVRSNNPLRNEELYSLAGDSENVVFLLLDGFGYRMVQHAQREFGFPSFDLVTKDAITFPITSVFPSTTSTATTTLHTGLTPQEHGLIGYTMYIQELGAIAEMLRFVPLVGGRYSLFELGFDPGTFIGKETIHEKLKREGIPSSLYIGKYITDSGLSKITNRGAKVFPHISASDMFARLRKNLESQRSNSFHFAYYPSPDTIAHARGPFTPEFAGEVEGLFHLLHREMFQKLTSQVAKKTTLIISADHGLAHVKDDDIVDLKDHRALAKMLRVPPSGDSRASYFHVKHGLIDSVEEYFETHFPGVFRIESSRSLLKEGLFGTGKVKEEVHDRIGDLVVVPKSLGALDNSNLDPHFESVPGRHGGLSDNEMLVPLIATKLSH